MKQVVSKTGGRPSSGSKTYFAERVRSIYHPFIHPPFHGKAVFFRIEYSQEAFETSTVNVTAGNVLCSCLDGNGLCHRCWASEVEKDPCSNAIWNRCSNLKFVP